MPSGTYAHLSPEDGSVQGTERFSCAAGPLGWRYTSRRIGPDGVRVEGSTDVTVDARWRQLRIEVRADGWQVRGGLTGSGVAWVRSSYDVGSGGTEGPGGDATGGEQPVAATEGAAAALGFTGRSPAFLVATARLLGLDVGARRRLHLVAFREPALAPLTVEQAWHLVGVEVHDTDVAPLRVQHYEVDDCATGERAEVHLAGDVVLAGEGWCALELAELDSPPQQL